MSPVGFSLKLYGQSRLLTPAWPIIADACSLDEPQDSVHTVGKLTFSDNAKWAQLVSGPNAARTSTRFPPVMRSGPLGFSLTLWHSRRRPRCRCFKSPLSTVEPLFNEVLGMLGIASQDLTQHIHTRSWNPHFLFFLFTPRSPLPLKIKKVSYYSIISYYKPSNIFARARLV